MPPSDTMAYVLSTRDYRDTSLLATFFTLAYGKVKAIVKGGRDARYRYGSTFEPFSLNQITIYKRKRGDLHLVTGAELIDRFTPCRSDLSKLGWSSYISELLDQLLDSEPHPEVFHLVGDTLHFMGSHDSESRVIVHYVLRLLGFLGFKPVFDSCTRCGAERGGNILYSPESGGVVCAECRSHEPRVYKGTDEALTYLSSISGVTVQEAYSAVLTKEGLSQAQQIVRHFCEHHLSYRPKSLDFLEKIGV